MSTSTMRRSKIEGVSLKRLIHRTERRSIGRSFSSILKKSHTQLLEFSISLTMLGNAMILLQGNRVMEKVLIYPGRCGVTMAIFGLVGIGGVILNVPSFRALFAMGGIFVSSWMAICYFRSNPFDTTWLNYVMRTGLLALILTRVFCSEAIRSKNRSKYYPKGE